MEIDPIQRSSSAVLAAAVGLTMGWASDAQAHGVPAYEGQRAVRPTPDVLPHQEDASQVRVVTSVSADLIAPWQSSEGPAQTSFSPHSSTQTLRAQAAAPTLIAQAGPTLIAQAGPTLIAPAIPSQGEQSEVAKPDCQASRQATSQAGACQAIAFIDAKLPTLQQQVKTLRAQMRQLQTQYTTQNLETHVAILKHRSAEVTQQQIGISQQLNNAELALLEVQTLLSLEPYEATFAASLLDQDPQYQDHLQQLQDIERKIVVEFSIPDLDRSQIESLYAQYQNIVGDLSQDAQDILARYVAIAQVESPNPLWQEPMYKNLLKRLMDTTHQQKVLALRQETIIQIDARLQERRTELATVLKDYSSLQQQLESATQVLQNYVAKRQSLETQLTEAKAPLPTRSEPTLATVSPTIPWIAFSALSHPDKVKILAALLIGTSLTALISRRQASEPRLKNFQLSLQALPTTDLIEPDWVPIEILIPEPLPTVSENFTLSLGWDNVSEAVQSEAAQESCDLFAALAVAIVMKTWHTPELASALMISECLPSSPSFSNHNFMSAPVALPIDDIDMFADEAIQTLFEGLDLIEERDDEVQSVTSLTRLSEIVPALI